MYRRTEVIAALLGRVGFRQPTQTEYAIVDATNQVSRSGRYYEGFHKCVTIPNIKDAVCPDPGISDADFNTYLQQLQTDCITAVLDGIFAKRQVIESVLEYNPDDQQPQLIENTGRFVGRQITVANATDIAVAITAISMYFDQDVTFNMYLFNGNILAPLKVLEVSAMANTQVIISPQDWVLNYLAPGYRGGKFWIGYFQDELGAARAYDQQTSRRACGKCFGVSAIEAAPVDPAPDFTRYNPAISSRTYGLNLELTTVTDFTNRILQNPEVFDNAIGLQMAATVVEGSIHTMRSNYTERLGEAAAMRLYNDLNLAMTTEENPYTTGLKNQVSRELTRVRREFYPKEKPISAPINDETCSLPRWRL